MAKTVNWAATRWLIAASVLLLTSIGGCGRGGNEIKRYAVSGTVTREGIPVDDGSVKFVPLDPAGVAGSAEIVDGRYEFTTQTGVPAGKYKVEIVQRPLVDKTYKGRKNEAPILEDNRFKNSMPPGGWVKEAEVTENSQNSIDFHLDE